MIRRTIHFVAFIVLLGAATGCFEPYRFIPSPPRTTSEFEKWREDRGELDLLYATDRNQSGLHDPLLYFGGDRTNHLKLGAALVSIPQRHGAGRVEDPSLLFGPRADRDVLLAQVNPPQETASFLTELQSQLDRSPRRELLVYIHGFNNTFSDAARRGAQIAHDIDFHGPLAIYSWPSQGWLLSYLVDAGNAEWTQAYLVSFLKMLSEQSGAEHIHLLAHSMGGRVLIPALRELVRQRPADRSPEFDQVILAAVDLDTELFERDYAPAVAQSARHVTIYVSDGDWALGSSQKLYRYARLGQPGNAETLVAAYPSFDVVDATAHDHGAFGHLYYGASPRVLKDLQEILAGKTCAERGLASTQGMWRIP